MGEGLGWGLNKTAQRQNPAFTSLGGFPSFAKRANRPDGLKPTLRKPCVYLAWRLSSVREAGDAAPVG